MGRSAVAKSKDLAHNTRPRVRHRTPSPSRGVCSELVLLHKANGLHFVVDLLLGAGSAGHHAAVGPLAGQRGDAVGADEGPVGTVILAHAKESGPHRRSWEERHVAVGAAQSSRAWSLYLFTVTM